MRTPLILAVLLLSAGPLAAAPAPENQPVKPKEEVGPVEIDFSPLPDDGTRYQFRIIVELEDGEKFPTEDPYTIMGLRASSVTTLVKETFESAGWKVQPVGGAKLIVEGSKGKWVKKLEIKAEGLQKENVPTVKRLPLPKKDK